MGIRVIVFAGAFMVALFLLGSLALGLMKKKASILRALPYGLVTALAVFQLVAYPLYRLEASFSFLFWIYTSILVALLAYALYRLAKNGGLHAYVDSAAQFFREAQKTKMLFVLLAIAMGVYLYVALGFAYESTDDGFYMPRAAEVLARNSLAFPECVAWTGDYMPEWPISSDASTLEFFKAYLSYCSGIPVAMLCRNDLALMIPLLSFAIVFSLAGELAQKRENRMVVQAFTLLFYILFSILYSLIGYSASFWGLRYAWQGKAMLCTIIFPMLMAECTEIYRLGKGDIPRSRWLMLSVMLTAGISLSIVGVFLPFILYCSLGIPYLLTLGWKRVKSLVAPILLSALPVMAYGGLTLLDVLTHNRMYLSLYTNSSWLGFVRMIFSAHHYLFLILYLGGMAYVCFRGSSTERLLFVGAPASLLLTFLNPLFFDVVSKYVTTGEVYYRLFWLLPTCLLPAYALGKMLAGLSRERIQTVTLTTACVLAVELSIGLVMAEEPAAFFDDFRKNYYLVTNQPPRENPYGLGQRVIDLADIIQIDYQGEGKPRLLATQESITSQIRQYTTNIVLAGGVRSKQRDLLKQPIEGTDVPQSAFYQDFTEGTIDDAGYLYDMLTRLHIDYVCVRTNQGLPDGFDSFPVEAVADVDEYTLWRIE